MTRSQWNHSICDECWLEREGEREPVRMKLPEVERCCFCGATHSSGIYVRHDPKELECQGQHDASD